MYFEDDMHRALALSSVERLRRYIYRSLLNDTFIHHLTMFYKKPHKSMYSGSIYN